MFPGLGHSCHANLPASRLPFLPLQEALNKLLLRKPLRPHNHPLATYHYTGRPDWVVTGPRASKLSSIHGSLLRAETQP